MKLSALLKQGEQVLTDNSPAILTGLGVAGAIISVGLGAKATAKAVRIIDDERLAQNIRDKEINKRLDNREVFELTWKLYIPTVFSLTTTCVAIVCANRIGTRRAAAVATAYAITEKAFDEYREKVVEKIGEKQEKEVHREVSKARMQRAESPNLVIMEGSGKVLCHDSFSNQFYVSDMETIKKAVNDINFKILHHDYATVNDFYDFLRDENVPNSAPEYTDISADMGWNHDKKLEIDTPTFLKDDRTPCITVAFTTIPLMNPWRLV